MAAIGTVTISPRLDLDELAGNLRELADRIDPHAPRFAKSARVTSEGLELDGVPFPFHLSADGVTVDYDPSRGHAELTLTVIVDGPVEVVP